MAENSYELVALSSVNLSCLLQLMREGRHHHSIVVFFFVGREVVQHDKFV